MAKETYPGIKIEGHWFGPDYLSNLYGAKQKRQKAEDYRVRSGITLNQEIALSFQNGKHLFRQFEKHSNIDSHKVTEFIKTLLSQTFGHKLASLPKKKISLFPEAEDQALFLSQGHVLIRIVSCDFSEDPNCRREWNRAFSDLQIVLNKRDEYLWGIVSNGYFLRILRDNDRISRHAYIEADLSVIFSEDGLASFRMLWILLHASRFFVKDGVPQKCLLEEHIMESRTVGERNRTTLRAHVREAIAILGNGFLNHPANERLREAIYPKKGNISLGAEEFYTELLHIVYRIVFLLTLEDRDLLHMQGETLEHVTARETYGNGYSMAELRDLALRPVIDRHSDLWEARRIVFHALSEKGEIALGLPGLGGIFETRYLPHLEECSLSNTSFLAALKELTWTAVKGQRMAVNWRDMGAEEFGGIYEGLLDARPIVDGGRFFFEDLDGVARKKSASYYTPDSLVQAILDSALNPVMEERIAGKPTNEAIASLLSLRIIDPACGSGHFLLGAARRIGAKICELREDLSPESSRQAIREAVHCLYGVDLNPMALELARMAIWLETHEAGKPLGFLGHRIQQGDSLLGIMDLSVLNEGIPDDAYKAISGDDKEIVSNLKKNNKKGRDLIRDSMHGTTLIHTLSQHWERIENTTEENVDDVHKKEEAFQKFQNSLDADLMVQACHLYTAAFLAPKTKATENRIPTSYDLVTPSRRKGAVVFARDLCKSRNVFHWPFAFPEALDAGGFDAVLGNPPWERIKLQEEEFFSDKSPDIANARNKADRSRQIENIKSAGAGTTERALYDAYITALQEAESSSNFCHGPRFHLTGKGDVNTYALFAETSIMLRSENGQVGLIIPAGIGTDDTTKIFFQHIINNNLLKSYFAFDNAKGIFPSVHRDTPFVLLTIAEQGFATLMANYILEIDHFRDERRFYTLTPEDIALINPNTRTSPTFRSQKDAELTKKIYARVPVFIREDVTDGAGNILREEANPWGISFMRMLDMSTDSNLFKTTSFPESLPLYEAKMVHHYNHRWATYTGSEDETRDTTLEERQNPEYRVQPRYWVEERQVRAKTARMPNNLCAAWLDRDDEAIHKELSLWVTGHFLNQNLSGGVDRYVKDLNRNLSTAHSNADRIKKDAARYPLSESMLQQIRECSSDADLIALVDTWSETLSPRWLLGWRDITNATNERTVIAGIIPRVGVGHTMPLMFTSEPLKMVILLEGNLNSLVLDFLARVKVGGTHLTYNYLKQFPIVPPDSYSPPDMAFIAPRVVELTYTAWDLLPFAEDILAEVGVESWNAWFPRNPVAANSASSAVEGLRPAPFPFDPERRALLRAELDAYYAKLYGLNRDELRYILDPADVVGEDYPTETFRVLKNNELIRDESHFIFNPDFKIGKKLDLEEIRNGIKNHVPDAQKKFLTQILVLDAWDRLERGENQNAATTRAEMVSGNLILDIWNRLQTGSFVENATYFPGNRREAFILALLPYLISHHPGLSFENYKDIAIIASVFSYCETFLEGNDLKYYKKIIKENSWLKLPRKDTINITEIRKTLIRESVLIIDNRSGIASINVTTQLPAIPSPLVELVPLYFKANNAMQTRLESLDQKAMEIQESIRKSSA
jgi:hypothetical protein